MVLRHFVGQYVWLLFQQDWCHGQQALDIYKESQHAEISVMKRNIKRKLNIFVL